MRSHETGAGNLAGWVVMVVAAIRPDHDWKRPLLRMVDTIVGIKVGVVGASVDLRTARRRASKHLKDKARCKVWM